MAIHVITEGRVHFAHHVNVKPFNIGDYLCGPYHYFNFDLEASSSLVGRCIVIGGGAIPDAENTFIDSPYTIMIVWATGGSVPLSTTNNESAGLRTKLRRIWRSVYLIGKNKIVGRRRRLYVSTRDPKSASSERPLLPCVSCLHPICDSPHGSGIAVVVNENSAVSGDVSLLRRSIANYFPEVVFETNALSESKLFEVFGSCDRLVTNSYHIAYWGLLSGRRVQLIGYSSKSVDLLRLLGCDADLRDRVPRGDGDMLLSSIFASLRDPNWASLIDATVTKAKFRQLNRDFAQYLTNDIVGLNIIEQKKMVSGFKSI